MDKWLPPMIFETPALQWLVLSRISTTTATTDSEKNLIDLPLLNPIFHLFCCCVDSYK
uniref:Uncharacterized protein n=1 Tax=Manihot esculenta TaxID=3983 RepID=A0A2C9WJS5_MANES